MITCNVTSNMYRNKISQCLPSKFFRQLALLHSRSNKQYNQQQQQQPVMRNSCVIISSGSKNSCCYTTATTASFKSNLLTVLTNQRVGIRTTYSNISTATVRDTDEQRQQQQEEWFQNFHQLVDFHQQNGHCHVQEVAALEENDTKSNNEIITRLAEWVQQQRILYRRKKLSNLQMEALQSIPSFRWNSFDAQWYAKFVSYQQTHNTTTTTPLSLRRWVGTQREQYARQLLTEERRELLESIGFVWSEHDEAWDRSYNQLKDIYSKYGNLYIINERTDTTTTTTKVFPSSLVNWIKRQRTAKKIWDQGTPQQHYSSTTRIRSSADLLTQERLDKLNAIQFVWDLREHTWNTRIAELTDHMNATTTSHSPELSTSTTRPYSPQLQRWIHAVRQDYVRYNRYKNQQKDPTRTRSNLMLNPSRIQQLENLNFLWNIRDARWETKFQIVKQHYEQHREAEDGYYSTVPSLIINNDETTTFWILQQRREYKKLLFFGQKKTKKYESLFLVQPNRLKKLVSMDFVWDKSDHLWNHKLFQLVQHKILYGYWPPALVPKKRAFSSAFTIKQQRELAAFVRRAYQLLFLYNNNKLDKNKKDYYRAEGLIEIGFPQ